MPERSQDSLRRNIQQNEPLRMDGGIIRKSRVSTMGGVFQVNRRESWCSQLPQSKRIGLLLQADIFWSRGKRMEPEKGMGYRKKVMEQDNIPVVCPASDLQWSV
jgi:hypothetical protein